jgi:hypothetical protein
VVGRRLRSSGHAKLEQMLADPTVKVTPLEVIEYINLSGIAWWKSRS